VVWTGPGKEIKGPRGQGFEGSRGREGLHVLFVINKRFFPPCRIDIYVIDDIGHRYSLMFGREKTNSNVGKKPTVMLGKNPTAIKIV
jgi:hypothetical protein